MKRSVLIGTFIIISISSSIARVINIPVDYATIQAGINASVNGDTILVQPGIFSENINFNGRSILLGSQFILTGDTSIIGETIIDGGSSGTTVTFNSGENNAMIAGFTIRNGERYDGGGILCDGANPVISNNIITGNSLIGDADRGGGIFCGNNSMPSITQNWIIGNEAGFGGGIASDSSSPHIEGNYILGNITHYRELGGNGGGIFCDRASSPIIRGNIIRSNSGQFSGGGIVCLGNVRAIIEDNMITENYGGGIQLGLGYSAIRRNIISGNDDWGISCSDFSGEIRNNIIAGHMAPGGGGINCYSRYFGPLIVNNLVSQNRGGIYLSRSTQQIVNSIIWGNDEFEIRFDSLSNPAVTYCDIRGGWPGIGNIDIDPLFRDTLHMDYHLQAVICGDQYNSPCIDAGNPLLVDSLINCDWGLGTNRSDIGAYGGGDSLVDGINESYHRVPERFIVSQNYPNPFNPTTTIEYDLPKAAAVSLEIYDLLGRKIESLVNSRQEAGHHLNVWNGQDKPSGIYFYRLKAGDYTETRKMLLLK